VFPGDVKSGKNNREDPTKARITDLKSEKVKEIPSYLLESERERKIMECDILNPVKLDQLVQNLKWKALENTKN
jgi:hypothetical protein